MYDVIELVAGSLQTYPEDSIVVLMVGIYIQ